MIKEDSSSWSTRQKERNCEDLLIRFYQSTNVNFLKRNNFVKSKKIVSSYMHY